MTAPYPLLLAPFYQSYLWGGRKLETVLGKSLPDAGATDSEEVWAESWEIVDHAQHSSRIANGPFTGRTLAELAAESPEWLFGAEHRWKSLPLLLKYLDCQRVLSVQVHPDDAYGSRMDPPDRGKTEAWVILDAQPGAVLYAGLKVGTTRQSLREAIEAGEVEQTLHRVEPKTGDCIFIPAGTVHALGAGLLVAEIQQASNTTFRLFDWNRVDKDGRPRPLHVADALRVIDFEAGPRPVQIPQPTSTPGRSRLVACDKFQLDRLETTAGGVPLAGDELPHLITAPFGGVELEWSLDGQSHRECLDRGASRLLPASMPEMRAEIDASGFLLDMVPAPE